MDQVRERTKTRASKPLRKKERARVSKKRNPVRRKKIWGSKKSHGVSAKDRKSEEVHSSGSVRRTRWRKKRRM